MASKTNKMFHFINRDGESDVRHGSGARRRCWRFDSNDMRTIVILVVGLLFHLTYVWSIFDIYFRSPLVHGMTPFQANTTTAGPPAASRLVLFVGDGLRADKLFEPAPPPAEDGAHEVGADTAARDPSAPPLGRAPFLRDMVLERGSWGVSHTRVPTESRPGHVAIVAGFYEDVSAVTKGWKMNPVNFDSVFNQSRHTWSFGSPDILPMFSHGASDLSRVETFMYAEEEEDWTQADASHLDAWVFNKFAELFNNATLNSTLAALLRKDKVVFFLHLLGLDSAGHAHRPHSAEYLGNVRFVDAGIRGVAALMDMFYGDNRTAYVFTSDHGMSNRGSHGDGHPDNTRTPIVVWGAGVAKAEKRKTAAGHPDMDSEKWKLDGVVRRDVNQADIAPLMSALLGLAFPMNSVGKLPIDYLKVPARSKAEYALINAKQIHEQFDVKQRHKATTSLFFRPFPPLNNRTHKPDLLVSQAAMMISGGEYEGAEQLCWQIIALCLEGLRYYQTYDWLFLRSIVSAGYIGWIAYSLAFVAKRYVIEPSIRGEMAWRKTLILQQCESDTMNTAMTRMAAVGVFLTLAALLHYQRFPLLYYLYCVFPVFFWAETYRERGCFSIALRLVSGARAAPTSYSAGKKGMTKGFMAAATYVAGLKLLVYSYYNRGALSFCFVLMALWPFAACRCSRWLDGLPLLWAASCLGTGVFPLLPVEKAEDIKLICAGGILVVLTGIAAFASSSEANGKLARPVVAGSVQLVPWFLCGSVVTAMAIVIYTTNSLQAKQGLPTGSRMTAWIVLVISLSIPFLHGRRSEQDYIYRLAVIYMSFAAPFILLSVSYEVLFYAAFSTTLLLWIELEKRLHSAMRNPDPSVPATHLRPLLGDDLRTTLFFLVFFHAAFFGTGNVASVSSFSLEAVLRLLPVFDPLAMGALLVLKLVVPFALLSAALGVLTRALRLRPAALFGVVLSTVDIVTLDFFYAVRDDGSWLDIGTSISCFVIASCFGILLLVLSVVAQVLVGRARVWPEERNKDKPT